LANPLEMIDRLPTGPLAIAAILLALAPFQPEPHLVEKIRMLVHGTLARPIDIFDLFMHETPLLLLLIHLIRLATLSRPAKPTE
jgi:hypothetical protein